ncbi:MAG: glycoside hydrolase family 13 protein [Lachnospiraceae bacterium]|nr:glycoside hydrolase family 13 protein [Lachnospiraceae bacterium]
MSLHLFFSDGTKEYRNPVNVMPGDYVTVRFRVPAGFSPVPVLHTKRGASPMRIQETGTQFDYYSGTIAVGAEAEWYYFSFEYEGKTLCYDRGGIYEETKPSYYFKLNPGFYVPEWAKGAVMYQIYVDRFYNGDTSNDVLTGEHLYIGTKAERVEDWNAPVADLDVSRFYGGDLKGVRKKLDYLQELGVEVIYFNPLFVSPSNHKYDIQDYDYIDPHFGVIINDGRTGDSAFAQYIKRTTDRENLEASNALFAGLVTEIHRRGMKVILDGVFNHCGSFNKWMDREGFYAESGAYEPGAYQSESSPYRDFFKFRNPKDHNSYEGWWGYETLPKLNFEESEELCEYICRVGAMWVSPPFNADGWRLDVAADLGHGEEFNHRFWKRFRKAVREANPNAVILAEHYGNAQNWLQGDEWDTVMNYDAFMEPVTWFLTGMEKHSDEFNGGLLNNHEHFCASMKRAMARFQTPSLYCAMNELSNHDHSRFLTRTNRKAGRVNILGAQEAETGINKAVFAEAVVLQMLWPGAPTVYYGDEAGLCGFTDPDNRRPYPWGREDKELIFLHKELIRIHRSYNAVKKGSFKMLHCEHGILSFGRFDKADSFFVAVNNNEIEKTVTFSVEELGLTGGAMVSLLLTTQEFIRPEARFFPVEDGKITLVMPPYSSFVLKNFNGIR